MKFLNGLFAGKGNVSSLSDILPCPRCNSLRSKSAPRADVPYYERRYQCKDCGQFFRFDTRLPEQTPQEFAEKENLNVTFGDKEPSKLILPK